MGAIILTHMLTSLNNLLFTCGEERFIQGLFNLNQQKILLIQIKPPADVTNFEGSRKATKERRVLRQWLHTCILQAQAQFKIWTQLRQGIIDFSEL